MREGSGGWKGANGSIWHVEFIPKKGRPVRFVTSVWGERSAAFEDTAPRAKAVSVIMDVPPEVIVAGNLRTPGWPPKAPIRLKSL